MEEFHSLGIADVAYIVASQQHEEKFLSEYFFSVKALEIVAEHLPSLVELYEFVHREFAYRISEETARKLTIRGMLNQLKNIFSRDESTHLKDMIKGFFGLSVLTRMGVLKCFLFQNAA